MENRVRYRCNVSQTSTGKMGFDCTVESDGLSMAEILLESDKMVAELKTRYEPKLIEKEK